VWALVPLLLAAALGIHPRSASLGSAQADAQRALEDGRFADASEALQIVLDRQPWRSALWETAGRAALSAGDPAAAVERLERADAEGAITAGGYLALGDALRLLGDWDAAVPYWEQARAEGADLRSVTSRLLEAHRRVGDIAAAIGDLQALVTLDPERAETHYQLGLLLAAREPEAALSALLTAAALEPGLQEAVDQLSQGLSLTPEGADPAVRLFNAGRALAGLEEWRLAAEAFRQALLVNGAYPEAWAFLGESMHHLGLDGGEMLETAFQLEPDSLPVNLLYALYHRRQGSPEEALVYLEQAAEIAPDEPAVAAETAQALAEAGEIDQALENFLRAVEMSQDDPTYLHLLASYSILNEIQVQEVGLPAARQAVLENPEDPVALDLIGYAYYVQGDWASALRFLGRALEADPGYAPARLHLGMLYLAREQPAEARRQLEIAVQLAPGTPAALQASEILSVYFP